MFVILWEKQHLTSRFSQKYGVHVIVEMNEEYHFDDDTNIETYLIKYFRKVIRNIWSYRILIHIMYNYCNICTVIVLWLLFKEGAKRI